MKIWPPYFFGGYISFQELEYFKNSLHYSYVNVNCSNNLKIYSLFFNLIDLLRNSAPDRPRT